MDFRFHKKIMEIAASRGTVTQRTKTDKPNIEIIDMDQKYSAYVTTKEAVKMVYDIMVGNPLKSYLGKVTKSYLGKVTVNKEKDK